MALIKALVKIFSTLLTMLFVAVLMLYFANG